MFEEMTIIYLGGYGFPFGMADVERQKLISRALNEYGNSVTIICARGASKNNNPKFPYKGTINGINYIYTSFTPYRSSSFITRNFLKIIGIIGEIFTLFKLRFKSRIDAAIVSTMFIGKLRYYKGLSKLFGFKIVLDYVEMNSSLVNRPSKLKKNDLLFDRYSPKYTDGIICISNYLSNHVAKNFPDLPIIKIPAICDFARISNLNIPSLDKKYFLFCGAVTYIEVIQFILEAFEICNNKDIELFLIVNGSPEEMNNYNKLIETHPKSSQIHTYSNLPHDKLIAFYKQARALLIPLRPTVQDIARFPHKIGEYTASGRPIITTNVGEVKMYFKDKINALIANEYDPKAFASKMEFVAQFPETADDIGKNGKDICMKNFDYSLYSQPLTNFLLSLKKI